MSAALVRGVACALAELCRNMDFMNSDDFYFKLLYFCFAQCAIIHLQAGRKKQSLTLSSTFMLVRTKGALISCGGSCEATGTDIGTDSLTYIHKGTFNPRQNKTDPVI